MVKVTDGRVKALLSSESVVMIDVSIVYSIVLSKVSL